MGSPQKNNNINREHAKFAYLQAHIKHHLVITEIDWSLRTRPRTPYGETIQAEKKQEK